MDINQFISIKEIENQFTTKFAPVFNGKESDGNWQKRNDTLRQLHDLMHHALNDNNNSAVLWLNHPHLFKCVTNQVIQNMDHLLIAANSLRTTLSITACSTISACAMTLPLDSISETMLASLAKLLQSTKKLILGPAAQCMATILLCTFISKRVAERIGALIEDKNAQVRLYSIMLIYELVLFAVSFPSATTSSENNHHHHPAYKHFEVWKVVILRGASDQNPNVRTVSRDCITLYKTLDQGLYDSMVIKLDANAAKTLAKCSVEFPNRPSLFTNDSLQVIHKVRTNQLASLSSSSFSASSISDLNRNDSYLDHIEQVDNAASNPETEHSRDLDQLDEQQDPSNESTDLNEWLARFQSAIDSQTEPQAMQCLTYIIHKYNDIVFSNASDSTSESDVAYETGGQTFRKAILLAIKSKSNSLILIALDDPVLLWAGFSLNEPDAVDLLVSLSDPNLGILVEPIITECLNEAVKSVYEDDSVWVKLLASALNSTMTSQSSRRIVTWVKQYVSETELNDWRHEVNGETWQYQLASDVIQFEQQQHDAMDGIQDQTDINEQESDRDPGIINTGDEDMQLAEFELDPVEELTMAIDEHRLTNVELCRYKDFVLEKKHLGMHQDLVGLISQLLAYSQSIQTDSGHLMDTDSVTELNVSDISNECVVTVHTVMPYIQQDQLVKVTQVLLDHVSTVQPVSPVAHWYTQCVRSLVVLNAYKVFETVLKALTGTDDLLVMHLTFLLVAVKSFTRSTIQISEIHLRDLESVTSAAIKSKSLHSRLVAVKLTAALTQLVGDQFLKGSSAFEPVHCRLVEAYTECAETW